MARGERVGRAAWGWGRGGAESRDACEGAREAGGTTAPGRVPQEEEPVKVEER